MTKCLKKATLVFSPVFSCFLSTQYRIPSHGMVPHILGVALLEVSSQTYPELCFPRGSHPFKLTVKIKHPVTAPLHAGRGWVAFHREFWALALAGPTAKTLFLHGKVFASSRSLWEPRRSGFKLQHGLTRAWFSLACSVFFLLQVPTYYLIYFVCLISPIRM